MGESLREQGVAMARAEVIVQDREGAVQERPVGRKGRNSVFVS